ncbi:hypothetical protein [Pseudonocardia sp. T1-2H]|uniref:hypothetical protein n=1 Tax=Pseudonocardia sp. T1-2H TaxID=3128899 RepID=UPI00310108D8
MTTFADWDETPRPFLPPLHQDVHGKLILHMLTRALVGDDPAVSRTKPGRGLFNNAIRLMDKTIAEYEAAQSLCAQWVDGLDRGAPSFASFFRATGHVETCIGTLHRTLLHLDVIRTSPGTGQVNRTAHRALQHATLEINNLRDGIEHAEKELRRIPEDSPALPGVLLMDERVAVGEYSINYADLSQWISQTFRLVVSLFGPPTKPATSR